MNKLQCAILRIMKAPEAILFLSWIVFAIAHCFFPVTLSDDAWFAEILAGDKATFANWLDFLVGRYFEWSSRTLIEGLLILFTRFPILWRVGDTLICIAISILTVRLFNPERNLAKNFIVVTCIFLFPIPVIYEVGYIATSLNYSWPFAAALLAITPVIKRFWGREVRKWEYIIAFPMMFLAGFQELICATSVLALLGSLVYRIVSEKKLPKFEIGMLTVAAVMLIYMLTCPGNDNRSMLETATWLPEYATLGFFQKVELGFSSMIKTIFLKRNIFVLIFSTVITISVWLQSNKWWKKVIAVFPTVFVLFFGTFGNFFEEKIGVIESLRSSVGTLGTGLKLLAPATWIPDLVFVAILVMLLLSLRFAVKETKRYWFLFFVLALGAASRMAMGLSPTVWASGERIFAFLYAAMTVVIGALLNEWIIIIKQHILLKYR